MKFVHLLTVPLSLAALTVMAGVNSCEELGPQRACRISDIQEMQFFGGDASCQRIRFCDEVNNVFVGVDESLHEPSFLETVEQHEGRVYLTNWLYYDAGKLCSADSAQVVPNVPAAKDFTLTVNLKRRSDGEQFSRSVHAVLTTIDFAPKVSNATHQVQLGGRNVAVFVQPTAVTELKLQANLTQTPAAGTISYQLPEMPATMTTVPAANTEATVSVSEGIAVGEGATVKATLEAGGETIEREADVRVVASASDPVIDIRTIDNSNCSGMPCGPSGEGTNFSRQCLTRRYSIGSVDGSETLVDWKSAQVYGANGEAVPPTQALLGSANDAGDFLLCYTQNTGLVEVRVTALGSVGVVGHSFEYDTARQ